MSDTRHQAFLSELKGILPKDSIYTDDLRCLSWGTDAGFYRLIPKIVIRSGNEEQVSKVLSLASRMKVPVTFRAAGTSLSGQAISDSVLLVAGKNWERFNVDPDSGNVTLEPGIVGARVNAILKPYGREFGPDPASIGSCMVGGIVMNNASGMSCGTHANSDKMMISARMVLPDGTVLDTGDEDSKAAFRASHPEFLKAIADLHQEVISNQRLTDRIKHKYSIKNVTGLNLLPLVTFDDPFDIMAHLLVGSEGTLAFLSRVTMRTLPLTPFKASAMIYFGSIKEAAEAVVAMKRDGGTIIRAAELLDKRSLMSVLDPMLEKYPDKDLTAVLTETTGSSPEELESNISSIVSSLEGFGVLSASGQPEFTSDPETYSKYWAIRSGIFPSVGGMRRQGTTCLIEDVAFHIEDLPEATVDLSNLLDKHGYDDSCIYGHALEGNFHFIINQSFDSEAEVRRYEEMIRDVAGIVVGKYDGSLKAEHGTGRNMAPFVEYEWGSEAFKVMERIKEIFDPEGILNPGVIFNKDPGCFLKDFKPLPVLPYGEKINKCIECGFCEVNCVSCGLTLSSRTRIVARREIARLEADPLKSEADRERLARLLKEYSYLGDETCAADGLCSMSCPMGIDVSDMTHLIREEKTPQGSFKRRVWSLAADHFPIVKTGVRTALGLASAGDAILGDKAMSSIGKGLHKGLGLPLWTPSTPKPFSPSSHPKRSEGSFKVVYFPSCLNQMMGLPRHGSVAEKPLAEEMVSLLDKAGYEVIFPEKMEKLCCGMMWESKGMVDIADKKTKELEEALLKASENGRWPVLCDQSPCLHRMRKNIRSLRLYEPAEFIMTFLKDRLVFHPDDTPVAVHVTCSTKLMGLSGTIISLAKMCSTNVIVPEEVGCCGFAGDKGMTHPELNAWALRKLKDRVKGAKAGYSNSRTCEIGLSGHSGIPYMSIAYLVDSHTTAGE
ncbi:MAG: FAD-binding oxidoreductase [Bacteroidales bacterium]|nr:FAD-binding oxidoreductase [Bacteroidales bacterium]